MKTLYESLLDDEDTILNNTDQSIRDSITKFLEDNYRGSDKCTITDKTTKYGKYIVDCYGDLTLRYGRKNLTNGLFVFGRVEGDFDCSYTEYIENLEGSPREVYGNFSCDNCKSLKTLEGAPEYVGCDFDCRYCENLISLKGGPKSVGYSFICNGCRRLKSLKGAPEKLQGIFRCSHCESLKDLVGAPKETDGFECIGCSGLKDLKGAPEKVYGKFTCSSCKHLTSLKGAPKIVTSIFNCMGCAVRFTEDDVKAVSRVLDEIKVYHIYESLLDDEDTILDDTKTSMINSLLKDTGFKLGGDGQTIILDTGKYYNNGDVSFGKFSGPRSFDDRIQTINKLGLKFQPLTQLAIYEKSGWRNQEILNMMNCDHIVSVRICEHGDLDFSKIKFNIPGSITIKLINSNEVFKSKIIPPKNKLLYIEFLNHLSGIPKDWNSKYMILYRVPDYCYHSETWQNTLLNNNPNVDEFIVYIDNAQYGRPCTHGHRMKFIKKGNERVFKEYVNIPFQFHKNIAHEISLLDGQYVDDFYFKFIEKYPNK